MMGVYFRYETPPHNIPPLYHTYITLELNLSLYNS